MTAAQTAAKAPASFWPYAARLERQNLRLCLRHQEEIKVSDGVGPAVGWHTVEQLFSIIYCSIHLTGVVYLGTIPVKFLLGTAAVIHLFFLL
jgi:hypothetical protein